MAKIVLATLNARYIHSAFGLRYLKANLGALSTDCEILEFVINDANTGMLAAILDQSPQIVGFGVYIWNVDQTTRLIADLKRVRPDIVVVIGGPEVSYEIEEQAIAKLADYVIAGEADLEFPLLCESILAGKLPPQKIHHASIANLDQVNMPYDLYTDEDIANRVIYVELSRGCPFTCEFCLSSLDIPVRAFDLDHFLNALQRLFDRGVRQFKFVDRTFNLNLRVGRSILQFFLDRYEPGMFLHFEMIPDRLPDSLRELIAKFPEGALQFEIGIQSFNPEVGKLISRKQDIAKLVDNFHFLTSQTGVHLHADLIVGLPGETMESFGSGFDQLYALHPQEIQVGILKRLRGTPIIRHDEEWQMVYSANPPYEILSNKLLSFEQIHLLRRFARHWDLIGNSGNFKNTLPLICEPQASAFEQFIHLSEWLYAQNKRMHGVSLIRLVELLFQYLTDVKQVDVPIAAEALVCDYSMNGRREVPGVLKAYASHDKKESVKQTTSHQIPSRQQKHWDGVHSAR